MKALEIVGYALAAVVVVKVISNNTNRIFGLAAMQAAVNNTKTENKE